MEAISLKCVKAESPAAEEQMLENLMSQETKGPFLKKNIKNQKIHTKLGPHVVIKSVLLI